MNIAILGAGAIGQLLAHQLDTAGIAPLLLLKPEQAILTTPFLFEVQGLPNRCIPHGYDVFSLDDKHTATILPEVDLLLVTLKAYQVVNAVKALLPQLSPHCHILLLHNGIGTHQELQPLLKGQGLSLGTTSQGALKLGPRSIRHTGEGMSQFGHFCGPALATDFKQQLLAAIPNSSWVDDILPALWQKLAVNAVINPLTALDNVPNGELTAARYQPTIKAVLQELQQVADQEQIALDGEQLAARVRQVMVLTSKNFSSMQQDVAHQRRTEIDYINGYVVKRAAAHQLAAPTNQALVEQITAREHAVAAR